MKQTYSAGGVIIRETNEVLLIKEGNFWGLPKGTIEAGEDALMAAKREIEEESGITDLRLITELGTYQRHPHNGGDPDTTEMKNITIFLFATGQEAPETNYEGNHTEWVKASDAATLLTDPTDRHFFEQQLPKICYS